MDTDYCENTLPLPTWKPNNWRPSYYHESCSQERSSRLLMGLVLYLFHTTPQIRRPRDLTLWCCDNWISDNRRTITNSFNRLCISWYPHRYTRSLSVRNTATIWPWGIACKFMYGPLKNNRLEVLIWFVWHRVRVLCECSCLLTETTTDDFWRESNWEFLTTFLVTTTGELNAVASWIKIY